MFFLSPHLGNMTMQTPRIGILHIFFFGGGGGGGQVFFYLRILGT